MSQIIAKVFDIEIGTKVNISKYVWYEKLFNLTKCLSVQTVNLP